VAAAERIRSKISVTVDPALLKAVDAYVAAHPGMDRSKVVDAALMRWYGEQQEAAIAAQHREPLDEVTAREMNDWRAIRRAAATRGLEGA
jgi:metal-responsive CopG/Arc/MetJ family transcriptional regulator